MIKLLYYEKLHGKGYTSENIVESKSMSRVSIPSYSFFLTLLFFMTTSYLVRQGLRRASVSAFVPLPSSSSSSSNILKVGNKVYHLCLIRIYLFVYEYSDPSSRIYSYLFVFIYSYLSIRIYLFVIYLTSYQGGKPCKC